MNKTKTAILGLLSVILISLDWWLISTALYQGKPLEFWLLAVGVSLVWIAVFSLFVLTNYNATILALVNAASLGTYFWFLPRDRYVLIGGVLFFILAFLFRNRVKSLEKNQSHFSLRGIVGGSIIILTYAFLLLIGFNLYYNTSQDFKSNPEAFYAKLGETAAKNVPFFSKGILDGISREQTLDEYLISQAQKISPGITPEQLAQAREEYLKRYDITAGGQQPFVEVLTQVVYTQVRDAVEPYEKFFPMIFTLVIIGLLRTFAFIFNWLGIFLSWLMFRLLLAANFFKIVKVQVEVDKLEI